MQLPLKELFLKNGIARLAPTCLLISDSRFSIISKARDQLLIESLQDGAFSPAVVESTYLAVTDFERVQGAPSSFEDTSEIPA